MCLVCCFVGRLHGTACHSASLKQSHTQPCRYMAAGGCTVVTTAPACCLARFTTSYFACPASCDGCFLKTPQLLQHLPHKHSDSIADFYDTLASKRRAVPRPPRDGSTFKFLFVVCTGTPGTRGRRGEKLERKYRALETKGIFSRNFCAQSWLMFVCLMC